MIKNKAILAEIERQKNKISCKNCVYCHLSAYHSGKWYCKNPNVSVFNPPGDIEKCFQRKEKVK